MKAPSPTTGLPGNSLVSLNLKNLIIPFGLLSGPDGMYLAML